MVELRARGEVGSVGQIFWARGRTAPRSSWLTRAAILWDIERDNAKKGQQPPQEAEGYMSRDLTQGRVVA
jgi:hypothetical protein